MSLYKAIQIPTEFNRAMLEWCGDDTFIESLERMPPVFNRYGLRLSEYVELSETVFEK